MKKVIASLEIELDATRNRNRDYVISLTSLREDCTEQDKKKRNLLDYIIPARLVKNTALITTKPKLGN